MGLALVLGLVAALVLALLPGVADAKAKKGKGHELTVMTRNLYLGADLSPVLNAPGLNEAIDAGGEIVRQVHATKFPSVRAALLANEIKKRKPDIVGLQEAAWWRTGPLNLSTSVVTNPTASTTDPQGGDFLNDLLAQLNKGGKKKGKKGAAAAKKKKKPALRYKIAVVKTEFDAELPVNDDGNGSGVGGADHNERLTMRDAILVKKGVKISNASSGTFNTLLQVRLAPPINIPVNVTRGWAAVDAKVNGKKVHVVDSHFEAFDSGSSNTSNDGKTYPKGGIREAQAKQLIAPGGPASSKFPTVLLGDFNSDSPVHGDQVDPGDALAYRALLTGGWSERAFTPPPFGCCIQDSNLSDPSSAGVTHRVDHIMSNTKKVKFKKGGLTTTYANGLWSSDHFGVWSRLQIK
jgi:endonuclease/exonuclease/phosphatase family metal-dependent hydrolase